jgi:hypothetical protein
MDMREFVTAAGPLHRCGPAAADTSHRGRDGMTDEILEAARVRYVARLMRDYPLVEDQLSDVDLLLDSLLDEGSPPATDRPDTGSLDAVRAAYLARLRDRCSDLDDQILELARASANLFAPALGLAA